MADDRIIVEIEMDDGKIVKGFANINKGAKQTGKSVEGIGNQIDKAFRGTPIEGATSQISRFVSAIKNIHPALLALTTATVAIGVAFERSLRGERINALNTQFELLSRQAGAATETLREGLRSATEGVVGFEDVLKSANKFVVEFGDNASRIPEVLELSRKASALFGGEVTANFERISEAIVSGQTRGLKSLGIIIDQEKAYKDYAKSIGTAAGLLNEAGKKQAILNAVLEKGSDVFKNVDPNINQLSTSVSRLLNQFGGLFDEMAKKSNSAFGEGFTKLVNGAADALERLNLVAKEPASGLEGFNDSMRLTELNLQRVQQQIAMTKDEIEKIQISGSSAKPTFDLGALESQRDQMESQLEGMQMQQMKFQKAMTDASKVEAINRANFIDEEKLAENFAKLKEQTLLARMDRLNAELELDIGDDERKALRFEQILLMEEMEKQKLMELDATYANLGLINTEEFERLKTEIVAKGNADRQKAVATAEKSISDDVILSGDMVARGLSLAIQQTVMAMQKGQNALKAFGGAILGFIGDMVIQIGTSLIKIGLGMEAVRASIAGMTGGPALFAGIALVALGTLLKSFSGGGGAAESSQAGGVGGAPGAQVPTTEPEIENQGPRSSIQLTVNGDVLDSQDTGLRIVDILRDFADKNGDVVTA